MQRAVITLDERGSLTDESVVTTGDAGGGRSYRVFAKAHRGGALAPARIVETLRAMGWNTHMDTMQTHRGCVTVEVDPGTGPGPHPRQNDLVAVDLVAVDDLTIRVFVRAPVVGEVGAMRWQIADALCAAIEQLGPIAAGEMGPARGPIGGVEPTVWHIVRADNDMRR